MGALTEDSGEGVLRWQEARGRYPSGTEQQFPPCRAQLCGLCLHPHQHMCLQLAQGHQPVTMALRCSPTESQADGEIRQLPLRRVAKAWVLLVNVVWQRECPDGVSRAMAHPGTRGPRSGPHLSARSLLPKKSNDGGLAPPLPLLPSLSLQALPAAPMAANPGRALSVPGLR